MAQAGSFSHKIEEFLRLSHALALTFDEECTLLSLDEAEWKAWREAPIPPYAVAPPLLARRMDYALELLRRMLLAWSGKKPPATMHERRS